MMVKSTTETVAVEINLKPDTVRSNGLNFLNKSEFLR